jgi:glycosyltransferase involved in cell wall biosynthesis
MDNILLVGPYSPRKCGIATHIVQFRKSLEQNNKKVTILSYADCDGDMTTNLLGGLNLLKLFRHRKIYSAIYVHFTPEQFFYVGHDLRRLLNFVPLISFFIIFTFLKNINFVFHEPPLSKYLFQRIFSFLIWRKINSAIFFTNIEKKIFEKKFFFKFKSNKFKIEQVNKYFIKHSFDNKSAIKNQKNVDPGKKIFLMTGFLHPNKGYDIPVQIFEKNILKNSLLYCMTSIRDKSDSSVIAYHNQLLEASNELSNFFYFDRFMEEKEQDSWIYLADFLILPYRTISNSGILGRAKLYDKKSIVSKRGGLMDQIQNSDILFDSVEDLESIIIELDKI